MPHTESRHHQITVLIKILPQELWSYVAAQTIVPQQRKGNNTEYWNNLFVVVDAAAAAGCWLLAAAVYYLFFFSLILFSDVLQPWTESTATTIIITMVGMRDDQY